MDTATASSSGIHRGRYLSTSYGKTMAQATTCYWRVDEVAADYITRTHGDVWQFTTQP
ncbi:MAG TPA: hypothetical protein VMV81_09255 [Phycisphaerae bacterium]|nr:hypothetical protein [Phycisphaerae bacterium]